MITIRPDYFDAVTCGAVRDFITASLSKSDIKTAGGFSFGSWMVPPPEWLPGFLEDLTPSGEQLETLRFSQMVPGNHHILHRDNQNLDGTPNHTPQRTSAAVLYLTENAYGGGRLVFPDYGVEIAPRPGLAVSFPGHFTHGVTELQTGVRQAITIWYVAKP